MREETDLQDAYAAAQLTLQHGGAESAGYLRIYGRVAADRVEELAADASRLLAGALRAPIVCDVADIAEPNGATVDLLARIRLAARGLGVSVQFTNVSPALDELLAVSGLQDVLPYAD